jgi:hypothetical protein
VYEGLYESGVSAAFHRETKLAEAECKMHSLKEELEKLQLDHNELRKLGSYHPGFEKSLIRQLYEVTEELEKEKRKSHYLWSEKRLLREWNEMKEELKIEKLGPREIKKLLNYHLESEERLMRELNEMNAGLKKVKEALMKEKSKQKLHSNLGSNYKYLPPPSRLTPYRDRARRKERVSRKNQSRGSQSIS